MSVGHLVPIERDDPLPGWCDRFLPAAASQDFWASRVWYDLALRHALPAGAQPILADCGAAFCTLVLIGGRLGSLTTPYTLAWRPLPAPGADTATLRDAGHALGNLLRRRPPVQLEALDPVAPGLDALLAGLRAAGMVACHFDNFGNWHERLAPGIGWAEYLAARPPTLRTTIVRKLARAERDWEFARIIGPGPALDAGIAAYEAVRARSWKPDEPAPGLDGALMRAVAPLGMLRLGVLRDQHGEPVAAQYWLLERRDTPAPRHRASLLKLAHVEAARATSPGTALTAQMIRELLRQDGVNELDFGRGDDPYKRLWVNERRQRVGMVLADPAHPAGLLAIARQSAGALRRRGRRLLGLGTAVR